MVPLTGIQFYLYIFIWVRHSFKEDIFLIDNGIMSGIYKNGRHHISTIFKRYRANFLNFPFTISSLYRNTIFPRWVSCWYIET